MTRLKTTAALLGAAALTLSLSACGGGGEYCDLIKNADEEFSLSGSEMPSGDDIANMTDKLKEIADAAPSDVKGDWDTMVGAFEAFAAAGDDPSAMDPEALEELGDVEAASNNVTKNVKEECDIDIS